MHAVDKSTFRPDTGLAELVRLSKRDGAQNTASFGYPLKIALLSNFSTQFLAMALPLALRTRSINVQIYEAGYNQWEQELLDPNAGILQFRPDIILLMLTSNLLYLREGCESTAKFAEKLARLINVTSERIPSRFVVTLPEPLEEELEQTSWAYQWRHRLVQDFRNKLEGQAILLDLEPLIIKVGGAAWYSTKFLVSKKLPTNPQITAWHADYLAQTIAAVAQKTRVRLIVVDLDNTLWGGVVGELGWSGVRLDPEGEGFAYLRLQRFLLGLHERGVLLAICSKNNPEDALEVFRRRPEMLLKENHFADIRINWEPKSSNIRSTLKALNLTATGTVFIDDSPFERGEVGAALTEVWIPHFPQEVLDLVPMLARTGMFSIPLTTREDTQRNEQYKQEHQRQIEASTSANLDEYYRTLGLILIPKPLTGDNLDRVLDLIAKTNQFNLTTRRYGRSDIFELLQEQGTEIWTYELNDRFGQYGIIAVVVTQLRAEDMVIDTWLMSCRAMGRTVEYGIFRHIFARAKKAHSARIVGEYISSPKNKPVENLYPKLGFTVLTASPDITRFVYADLGAEPRNEFVLIRD